MNVCIEISTFNNKEVLNKVLDRLAQQTYPTSKFKVILSDDGSSDGLLEMVESIRHKMTYKIVILKNKHQGAAEAHNQGIRACDDGLVIMMAADILASPDFIQEHVNTHKHNEADNVVVVGKLVQSKELPQTIFQQSWDKLVNALFSGEMKELQHKGFFVSNMSFKRVFMIKHGMFLNWPPAAQEDIELGYRLTDNGMKLIINHKALGFHHHQATLNSVARRAYMEGYNWHYFADHMEDCWVHLKIGQVKLSDGLGVFVYSRIKKIVRNFLFNHFTVTMLIIPTIKAAEKLHFLAPVIPILAGKMASYYFQQGLRDFKNNIPWNTQEIHI